MTKKVYKHRYLSLSTKNSNQEISKDKMGLRMKNFNIFEVHWEI